MDLGKSTTSRATQNNWGKRVDGNAVEEECKKGLRACGAESLIATGCVTDHHCDLLELFN